MTITNIIDFAIQNQAQFEDHLMDCLAIPSISTLSQHAPDIQRCAKWVADYLPHIGIETVEIINGHGNPIVYAEHHVDSSQPTLLLYGHYDVQPVDPLHLWDTPPFQPRRHNGYIFARGASDNKGMFLSQIMAIESYLRVTKTLPVNIKFLIEGEEEIGSSGLASLIQTMPKKLNHDALLVSDSPKFSDTTPSICTSIRGLVYMDVSVTAMASDVHSGQLGGGVPNVIHYVAQCIASMKDPKTNRILVPGFYDNITVSPPKMPDRDVVESVRQQLNDRLNLGHHANADFFNNTWFLPTLDCNGITSGFTDDGAKTVIPANARFKISSRLVGGQCPKNIYQIISNYIKSYFPNTFKVHIQPEGPLARPMQVDHQNSYIQVALRALKATHKKPILIQGEGGSIPILAEIQSYYGTPIVMIGLNSPDDNIHAPNERFKQSDFLDGIKTYIHYLDILSRGVTY
ncbi:MAG: M20/M25/M40 family metallo-hydrolase [Candidatus Marinamargulisbacteria bacterium]